MTVRSAILAFRSRPESAVAVCENGKAFVECAKRDGAWRYRVIAGRKVGAWCALKEMEVVR